MIIYVFTILSVYKLVSADQLYSAPIVQGIANIETLNCE